MKGLRSVVLPFWVVLAFLADAAMAQTGAPTPTIRRYDSLIQMHAAPVTLQVPDDSLETQKDASKYIERDAGVSGNRSRDLFLPNDMPQESQIRPNGPRLKEPQEKKQDKSWLRPSSTKTGDEDKETLSNQQEEPVPSGWGWLADDVRSRQQKQQAKEDRQDKDNQDNDSKKSGDEFGPRATHQEKSAEPKSDGIFLSTAFKPVSSSTPTRDDEDKADDASARNESSDRQKTRPDGPTTAQSPLDRSPTDQPREQKFGADATWGNESLWDKNAKAVSTLPQTEALLSMSKLGAKTPSTGLDRPGFKRETAQAAVNRVEPNRPPDSAPRTFIAPVNFQPLRATPINELGNDSWAGDLPGKSSFGGSAPFSAEPGISQSRPVESLKAPALPKPVSPWLK
jgi:hypothetical protein